MSTSRRRSPPASEIIEILSLLYECLTAEQMRNRIEFL